MPSVLVVAAVCFFAGTLSRSDESKAAGDSAKSSAPASDESVGLPSFGNKNASVYVVEFSDFNCPHCRALAPYMRRLMLEYGDRVRFIYQDSFYSRNKLVRNASINAASGALAAHRQGKFWEFHDHLFRNTDTRWTNDDLIGYAKNLGLSMKEFKRDLLDPKTRSQVMRMDAIMSTVKSRLRQAGDKRLLGVPAVFVNGMKIGNPHRLPPIEFWRMVRDAEDDVKSLIASGKAKTVAQARKLSTIRRFGSEGELFVKHFDDTTKVSAPALQIKRVTLPTSR